MSTATGYQYNKDQQIVGVIRPDSGVIETIYDTVGCGSCGGSVSRPKEILFDRGAIDFRYSSATGLLDTLMSPQDTATYTYDGSMLTSVSGIGANAAHLYYDYDNNFRLSSQELWVQNPNAPDYDVQMYYGYNQDGLLSSVEFDSPCYRRHVMSISRDMATGRVTQTYFMFQDNQSGFTTNQDYDTLGACSYYEADFNGSSIFQTSYERDSLGRISILTEVNQGRMTVKQYAYDVLGRLSQVWRNDTLISTYSYDPNGNRKAHIMQATSDSGTYDVQDRMLSYGNAQYIYSKNGELQKKIVGEDTTSYTYDYFGNLIKVVLPNRDVIEYVIDGQNRRIGKKLNGAIVKKWIYAGQLSPIAELDSSGNVTAQFMGNFMSKNCAIYQFITDQLGSVRMVVNVYTGEIVQQMDYDEFGNVLSNSNPDFQPFAYAGGLYDGQTKLVRFGVRDYDASVGRWTSKDPLIFWVGSSNLFLYVNNDPINHIDKTGQWNSEAHEALLRHALGAHILSTDLEILIAESELFDSETAWAIKYAPWHSMRRPGQSIADAIREREDFIAHNLSLARKFACYGDIDSKELALHFLGEALHTLMDSSSPMHVDENGNPYTWPSFPNFFIHAFSEGVSDITPQIYASQDQILYGAYNYVFEK